MLTPVSGFLGGGLEQIQGQSKDSPEQLRKVGAEFESLLLTQMLKSMRESSSGGWLGGGEDQAGTVMVEMAGSTIATESTNCYCVYVIEHRTHPEFIPVKYPDRTCTCT